MHGWSHTYASREISMIHSFFLMYGTHILTFKNYNLGVLHLNVLRRLFHWCCCTIQYVRIWTQAYTYMNLALIWIISEVLELLYCKEMNRLNTPLQRILCENLLLNHNSWVFVMITLNWAVLYICSHYMY